MSYFMGDDDLAANPKVQSLTHRAVARDVSGLAAMGLWVVAGTVVQKHHSDGFVKFTDLLTITLSPEVAGELAADLEAAGLWHGHGHSCPRCPPVPEGCFYFHDWADMRYERGEQAKQRQAKSAERNSVRLRDQVWERDRLSTPGPSESEAALCAYCLAPVRRSDKRSDHRPEVDHIDPDLLGLDNLVIACWACNHRKGAKRPADAGLTLHVTDRHRADLVRRGVRVRPLEGRRLPRPMWVVVSSWPLDPDGLLLADATCSHPAHGAAGPVPSSPACGPDAEPARRSQPGRVSAGPVGVAEPAPGGGAGVVREGSPRTLAAGPLAPPAAALGASGRETGRTPGRRPVPDQDGRPDPGPGPDQDQTRSGPDPGLVGAPPRPGRISGSTVVSSPPDRTRTRPGPDHCPVRTRGHAPASAGAGRAGQGQGTSTSRDRDRDVTGQGTVRDRAGGRRRRRRRGRGRGRPSCPEHGDTLPCRMCTYQSQSQNLEEI